MTTTTKRFRLGMDSGGTFTDIVVLDLERTEWRLYKILSQHHNPAAVLHAALEKSSEGAGMGVAEFVEQTEMLIIGTTVATNALLQHRGAKVGLLATAGHEDALEIREGHKEDGHRYDWDFPQAQILVPGSRRLPITERVLYDGSVRTPLEIADVEAAIERFAAEEVDTIAVSYLWSFQNSEHEAATATLLRERLPDTPVTVSHELLPMIGDYNRVSTVVLNAYVQPVVRRFVDGMEAALAEVGFTGPVRYFQANGGMSSAHNLVPKAIYALNSGPAAAPTAGAQYSQMYGKDAITIDAGGTSLDIGLVRGATTDVSLTSDVARYRIGIPMVNIETLGAGGGSIAWYDSRGILSVGPQSAESRPGPACYGLGGEQPTVTDALVVLGWFNQEALLGGEMPIDAAAAFRVVDEVIARPGGMTVEQAAEGIIRVAVNNMVGGIRRISVERGYDVRDAVLVGIGGSGPAVSSWIGAELEMDTVVIPRVASGFCAFGAALSEVKHDYVATYTTTLDDLDLDRLNAILSGLEERGARELAQEGVDASTMEVRRAFEMRYHDQVHNCLVPVAAGGTLTPGDMDDIRAAFDRRHEELYTYSEPDNRAVLINVHTSVIGNSFSSRGGEIFRPALTGVGEAQEAVPRRDVYLGSRGERVPAPVVRPGDVAAASGGIAGPAIVEETTTTIVVDEGWTVRLDDRGHYEMTRVR